MFWTHTPPDNLQTSRNPQTLNICSVQVRYLQQRQHHTNKQTTKSKKINNSEAANIKQQKTNHTSVEANTRIIQAKHNGQKQRLECRNQNQTHASNTQLAKAKIQVRRQKHNSCKQNRTNKNKDTSAKVKT